MGTVRGKPYAGDPHVRFDEGTGGSVSFLPPTLPTVDTWDLGSEEPPELPKKVISGKLEKAGKNTYFFRPDCCA